ncbi:MAG TPA: DeoR family transcriptional regulator [Candidatus Dojkabacteria bacterium]|nr:DeoR family transcriptional regulator [Candidatus Dojkabacteria bacterium]
MKNRKESFGFFSLMGTILVGALTYLVVRKLRESDDYEIPAIEGIENKRSVVVYKRPKRKSSKPKKKVQSKKENRSVLTNSAAEIRQKKLFDYIKKNKSLVMSEALDEFKDINERTLRRDLVAMVKKGLIKKYGSTKSTKYVLK